MASRGDLRRKTSRSPVQGRGDCVCFSYHGGVRRRLLTVAIFLLLGAVVNVAVAWGCAMWSSGAGRSCGPPTEGDLAWWRQHGPPGFSEEPSGVMDVSGFGVSQSLMWIPAHAKFVSRTRTGWPIRSMEGARWYDRSNRRGFDQRIAFLPQWLPKDRIFVPLRPLLSGTAANTAVYSVLLWLVFLAFIRMKRRWRTQRGRCIACGYPLGTSPVCTECGHQLSAHSATS